MSNVHFNGVHVTTDTFTPHDHAAAAMIVRAIDLKAIAKKHGKTNNEAWLRAQKMAIRRVCGLLED